MGIETEIKKASMLQQVINASLEEAVLECVTEAADQAKKLLEGRIEKIVGRIVSSVNLTPPGELPSGAIQITIYPQELKK